MSDVPICVLGGRGTSGLPSDAEQEWPRGLRIVMYLLGLGYCFMGVAIIADVFMGAIEKVTSKKVRLFNQKTQRYYTFEVWNATVANLTLMALGSSAPEILLNVIDIFARGFILEGLGPSTIVGSAAFNMLMIIAVCIVSIPDGEIRYIKDMTVYMCTASWSVFAYIWLIVILLIISPHVVEVWEGVLTFLFFPMLTFHAFACDKGWIGGKDSSEETKQLSIHEDMTEEELAEVEAKVRSEHGQHLTAEQISRILAVVDAKPNSRAKYRVGATRSLFGGKRLKLKNMARSVTKQMSFLGSKKKIVPVDVDIEEPVCKFEFKVDKLAVLESAGTVKLTVVRTGDISVQAKVYYKTADGSAKEKDDYVKVEGWLEFTPGQKEAEIAVEIVDDEGYEEDEDFFVQLSQPQAEPSKPAALAAKSKATITIIDDDEAGVLSFPNDGLTISQQAQEFEAQIEVKRTKGSCGTVKVQYQTEGATAIPGRDFDDTSGELVFSSGQMAGYIAVKIKVVPRYDNTDCFRVVLSEPSGGAKLDEKKDGGAEKNILTVTIQADEATKERVARVKSMLAKNWDKSKVGHANWASQFKSAVYVNGGDDEDEGEEEPPSAFDWVMHIISLPWKLLFALVPPTDYCGGWVCFCISLGMIGVVTLFIGDLASLLGCVMCIPDDITAITFVALGTSLPDTFASKTAALQDPYADASVGNVTGSNSVNVFLGLGLPWMIAGFAWAAGGRNTRWNELYQMDADLTWLGPPGMRTDAAFVVKAGSLAFSVTVFSICAVCCIALLAVRRKMFGGELGGPKASKWLCSSLLGFLWLCYIGLSSWKSLSDKGGARCVS